MTNPDEYFDPLNRFPEEKVFPESKKQIIRRALNDIKPLIEVLSAAVQSDPKPGMTAGKEISLLLMGTLAEVFIDQYKNMNNATCGQGSVCNRASLRKWLNNLRNYFNEAC